MRRALGLFLLVTSLLGLTVAASAAGERAFYVTTKEGRRACIEGALFLRVPVPKKGGVSAVAKKYTGGAENAGDILSATGLSSKTKKRPVEVRIPIDLLLPTYRDEVLEALFPDDERGPDGWHHTWAGSPLGDKENWNDIARWFAGSPKRAAELQRANAKAGKRPKAGTVVLVPEGVLADALAEIEPPAVPAPRTTPRPATPQPPGQAPHRRSPYLELPPRCSRPWPPPSRRGS